MSRYALAASCGTEGSGALRSKEFEQVVSQADDAPLGADLVVPAQQEAADASGLLGLAEDGFHHDLAPAVELLVARFSQLVAHGARRRVGF